MASGALMHELEAILHEYLSFNWDRMEEMSTANAACQRKEGLACPWRPSRDFQHSVRTCTLSVWDMHSFWPCLYAWRLAKASLTLLFVVSERRLAAGPLLT